MTTYRQILLIDAIYRSFFKTSCARSAGKESDNRVFQGKIKCTRSPGIFIMIYPPHLQVALLQAALCLVASAAMDYVDDTDSRFQYHGNWEKINGNMSKGGSHVQAYTSDAFATITYTCEYLLVKVNYMIII